MSHTLQLAAVVTYMSGWLGRSSHVFSYTVYMRWTTDSNIICYINLPVLAWTATIAVVYICYINCYNNRCFIVAVSTDHTHYSNTICYINCYNNRCFIVAVATDHTHLCTVFTANKSLPRYLLNQNIGNPYYNPHLVDSVTFPTMFARSLIF